MKLAEVIPWGRNFAEYKRMFKLSEPDLQGRILGCGDGPASFNAEMTAMGYSVVSVDPLYDFSAVQIRQRIQTTYDLVMSQVEQQTERYVWTNFRNADELGRTRLAAMEQFLGDYETGKAAGRYLNQSLPSLTFSDRQFDLSVCSHFLFLYSEQRSLAFHLAALAELLRVSVEVRLFPLLALDGARSPHLEPAIATFTDRGIEVAVEPVPYEFQKGGNQMLRMIRQ